MANPTNLYEYYTGQGQSLPSLQQRSQLYQQYGLGQAGSYMGTAQQNAALLGKLTAIPADTTQNPQQPANLLNFNPPIVPQAQPVITQPTAPQSATGGSTGMDWLKQYLQDSQPPERPDVSQQEANVQAGQQATLEAQQAQRAAQAESDIIANKLRQLSERQALEKQGQHAGVLQEGISARAIQGRDIVFEREQAMRDSAEIYALNSQQYASQAKIAQASGDVQTATTLLGFAQDELNKKYQMQQDYNTAVYNWKQGVLNKLYDYMSKEEQRKADEQTLKLQQDFQLQRDEASRQHDVAMANLSASLKPATGTIPETTYKNEVATQGRNAVSNLLSIAELNKGIFGRTASLPIPDFLRSDAFRNYKAQIDYLKGNIIPAALSAMRDASKTGGALGQVSDREGAWLASSLGALDMSQSPEAVIKSLKEIDAHLATWQNAINQYGGSSATTSGTTIMIGPDGIEYNVPNNQVNAFIEAGGYKK